MRGLVTIVTLSWLATACGMIEVPKKIDRTNSSVGEMNGKMDQTNDGLDQMNGKVDQTNGGLEKTNEGLAKTNGNLDEVKAKLDQTNAGLGQTNAGLGQVSGQLDKTNEGLGQVNTGLTQTNEGLGQVNAGLNQTNAAVTGVGEQVAATNASLASTNGSLLSMLDEIRKTNAGMDQMNGQMQMTNEAIHSQILLLSLQEMQKTENQLVLFPPVGMMPAGKKFAGEARTDEVLELTYSWLVDVDRSFVDAASLRSAGVPENEIERTLARFDHQKEAKIVGLEIVNGFLPQKTVEGLAQHVAENGRYKQAALAALEMRVLFITTMLLEGGLFGEKLTLKGQMLEAAQLVAYVDYLGRLPFAKEIAVNSSKTGEQRFDAKQQLTYLFGELDKRFDSELDPAQAAELAQLRAKIKEGLAYWQGQAG